MGRPKKTDRESVKEVTLTLKLTAAERARLDALVAQREAELSKLTGQRIEVSASAFLRWLMDERARAVGAEALREPKESSRGPEKPAAPVHQSMTAEESLAYIMEDPPRPSKTIGPSSRRGNR